MCLLCRVFFVYSVCLCVLLQQAWRRRLHEWDEQVLGGGEEGEGLKKKEDETDHQSAITSTFAPAATVRNESIGNRNSSNRCRTAVLDDILGGDLSENDVEDTGGEGVETDAKKNFSSNGDLDFDLDGENGESDEDDDVL